MVQSKKSERTRQQKHRDWLLLGDANRERQREIEKQLAYPHPDSNLTRICFFRSDRISEKWVPWDVHHEPTAEEVSDFDEKLITRLDYIDRVTVMLLIDNGNFIDMDTPQGRFTLGFDAYGR